MKKTRSEKRRELADTRAAQTNVTERNNDASTSHAGEYRAMSTRPLTPMTDKQDSHLRSMLSDVFVVGIGPAGTGKTYMASACAANMLMNNQIKKIVMTRPNVEVGPKLGFLPGDINDKFGPYIEPFKEGLLDRLGSNKYNADYGKRLLPQPIAYMRGRTFNDAVVLLDEAQNTTIIEMKMILTRLGIRSKLFVTGDIGQCDLNVQTNGLQWLVNELRRQQKTYDIIEYTKAESVRSEFCMDMLEMIENAQL